jgi:hypothetical protein
MLDQSLAVHRIAWREGEDLAPEGRRRRERGLQTTGRHDHPEGFPAKESAEEARAARVLLPGARIAPEGRVRYRHENNVTGYLPLEGSRKGAEIVENPEGGRLVGDDHQRRASRREDGRERERRRRAPQALELDP